MRAIFGVVGLLVVVVIVGMLAKKQLAGVAPRAANGTEAAAPAATPQQQVKQFEQAVQGAMQQARPMPDTDK
jgi:type II secretory pathway pseudopilin PulG